MSFLKLTPGSVTPLGILSDEQSLVKVFLDKEFLKATAASAFILRQHGHGLAEFAGPCRHNKKA